ncbi:MAG TPA: alginate lyase family protein, partial [Vulgatibacter sp.]
ASSAADLPRAMRRTIPGPLALGSVEGVRAAARALREQRPLEADAAVERAERSLGGRIEVFGREVDLRRCERSLAHVTDGWRPIDWEADPWEEHGAGASTIARADAVTPDLRRAVRAPRREPPDPKRQWVVGRLEEAVHLACGAALLRETEPARAASFARASLDRMVDFAQAPRGIQWACAMEVSLRAANMAIALRLLAADPVAEARPLALLEILRSIALHVAWVPRHLEDDGAIPNNHLVADWTGMLVVAALLPRLPGAGAWALRASRGLSRELSRQVLPDGFSFEGSVGYHRLALELFTLGELCARAAGAPIDAEARRRLARMYRATLELHDPSAPAPRFGDDDSGRAIPFGPRPFGELGWILALGAASLGMDELGVEAPGSEVYWLLGARAAARHRARRKPAAPKADASLPHAGIYVLRSPRTICAISCGPNGTAGLGTHGHNDKLSFELRVDGRPVVVDPGSGSYTGDPTLRNRLRGTAAHSTVRVDGGEQQAIPSSRLFALPEQARARCVSFESERSFARFVGEHLGYRSVGVVHRRLFYLDRGDGRLTIEDRLEGSGVHRLELRFVLPDERADLRPRASEAEGRQAAGRVVVLGDPDDGAARLVGPPGASARLEEGVHAEGYGRLVRSRHVVFEIEAQLPVTLRTRLEPARAGARLPADDWPSTAAHTTRRSATAREGRVASGGAVGARRRGAGVAGGMAAGGIGGAGSQEGGAASGKVGAGQR